MENYIDQALIDAFDCEKSLSHLLDPFKEQIRVDIQDEISERVQCPIFNALQKIEDLEVFSQYEDAVLETLDDRNIENTNQVIVH